MQGATCSGGTQMQGLGTPAVTLSHKERGILLEQMVAGLGGACGSGIATPIGSGSRVEAAAAAAVGAAGSPEAGIAPATSAASATAASRVLFGMIGWCEGLEGLEQLCTVLLMQLWRPANCQ